MLLLLLRLLVLPARLHLAIGRRRSERWRRPADRVGVPSIAFSSSGALLAYAFSDDWTAGEERYQRLCTAGHSNAVKVIAVPEA